MAEWTGTLTEKGETAKSFKYKGSTSDGKSNTFWQGKDHRPLPIGEPITITYKVSEYERDGEKVQSKWVESYTSEQPETTEKPQTRPSSGSVPFGYVGTPYGEQRTMPTVKEQKAGDAWGRILAAQVTAGQQMSDPEQLLTTLCKAWENVMEIGEAERRVTHRNAPEDDRPEDRYYDGDPGASVDDEIPF